MEAVDIPAITPTLRVPPAGLSSILNKVLIDDLTSLSLSSIENGNEKMKNINVRGCCRQFSKSYQVLFVPSGGLTTSLLR